MRLRLLEPWRSRLLWVSLALNLFAAALIGAPHVWQRHSQGPPSFDGLVERMARDLPAADAATFRAEMGRERPWYDMGRDRIDQSREGLAAAVATDPFDPAIIRTALAAMQDRMHEAGARFNDSLVQALAKLSPDGRTKLAESMRKRRP